MAHQIKDEKQEYQYTGGFTTPSGHEFHYYDTPKNERFVIKHASGSHIEFKADGSVMIKSLKDLHMESSIVSDATESSIGGEPLPPPPALSFLPAVRSSPERSKKAE